MPDLGAVCLQALHKDGSPQARRLLGALLWGSTPREGSFNMLQGCLGKTGTAVG